MKIIDDFLKKQGFKRTTKWTNDTPNNPMMGTYEAELRDKKKVSHMIRFWFESGSMRPTIVILKQIIKETL